MGEGEGEVREGENRAKRKRARIEKRNEKRVKSGTEKIIGEGVGSRRGWSKFFGRVNTNGVMTGRRRRRR